MSPDNKYLFYGLADIHALRLTEGGKPEPYLNNLSYAETFATFSPDGRWVAYASDESGRFENYVQGFPDKRGKWLVSEAGGSFPAWRADGKELFLVDDGRRGYGGRHRASADDSEDWAA